MYFIELLVKKFRKNKQSSETFNPLEQNIEENSEACEHIFMPIDSTGEILACRNCGFVVERNKLKDINFFRKHN